MKHKYLIITIFIFAALGLLLVFAVSNLQHTPRFTPGGSFNLSLQELIDFEQKASKGDIEAMKRLGDYYSMYVCDDEKGMFWLDLAAYAGDRNLQEGLVYRLTTSKLDSDRKKGAIWANKWRITVNP